MRQRPRVGVCCILRRKFKRFNRQMNVSEVCKHVLLMKRHSMLRHAPNYWCFPSGHLEFGEEPEDGVIREVKEETGLQIANPILAGITHDRWPNENRQYMTMFFVADFNDDTPPRNMEPTKCTDVKWFHWNRLPKLLMPQVEDMLFKGFDPWTVTKETKIRLN